MTHAQRGLVVMACVFAGLSVGQAPGAEPPIEPIGVVAADGPDRGARQPQAAVDGEGRVFVAFGVGDAVRCAGSADGGRTFGAPTTVGSAGTLALGMRRGPRIAATRRALVVTAIAGRRGVGRDGDVWAWRSTDAGRTWVGPARLNAVEGSAREGLHGLAAGPDGAVFCAWLDLRHDRMEVFGARSGDGGATWEPDHLVYRSPERSICECCHPSVAFAPDGTLCVMWRNNLKGARDLYLTRSNDGGRTFAEPTKLGRGTWPLNACPMDGGAVAAGRDGRVETVWTRAGVLFAARPGQDERRLGPGVQGWIALGPEGTYVVWLTRRPGPLRALLPGARSPRTLAETAIDPVVAAGPDGRGPVVAAWEGGPGTAGIMAAVLAPGDRSARSKPGGDR